jgi:YD repeat-containing protein
MVVKLIFWLFFICSPSILVAAENVVGSISGSIDVSLSGSASYSIPIRTAPGTAGTEPKISLAYDSQASSGAIGAGWVISGLSVITRGPKTYYSDHQVSGINFDENDALYLDGQRLVAISKSGEGLSRQIEYRKESDDLTRIIQTGESIDSSSFVAQTKGGVIIEFNGNFGSNIKIDGKKILLFAESRIIDTTGNFIEFHYSSSGNGNYDVSSIRYTGHEGAPSVKPYASIDFEYEKIDRTIDAYIGGNLLKRDTRLKSVISRIKNNQDGKEVLVARYDLEYENRDTANRFVLSKIHQFGEEGSEITPTNFKYSEPKIAWTEAKYQIPIEAFAKREKLTGAYKFVHFSNDAIKLPDLLFSAKINGAIESYAFQNLGGTWKPLPNFNPKFAFVSDDGSDLGAIVEDINGDGRADLLQGNYQSGNASEISTFLAENDTWQISDKYKLPFKVSEDGKRVAVTKFIKLTGGPGPDLIYTSGTESGFLVNTTDGWKSDKNLTPKLPISKNTKYIDVDCNGISEIVEPYTDKGGQNIWKIYSFNSSSGWSEIQDSKFQLPFSSKVNEESIQEIDLNQDGCKDIIYSAGSSDSLRGAYIAQSSGWKAYDEKKPPFILVNDNNETADAIFIDVDKDNKKDLIAHTYLNDGTEIKLAYRQTDTGWDNLSGTWKVPLLSGKDKKNSSRERFIIDIDGNGYLDIVQSSGSVDSFGSIYAGIGSGYEEKNQLGPPLTIASNELQDRGIRLIDLDADGLLDILYRRDKTISGNIQIESGAFKNTGNGWVSKNFEGLIPPEPLSSDKISYNPAEFADVDGDGYIDLLYSYRDRSGNLSRNFYHNEEQKGARKWVKIESSGFVPPKDIPFSDELTADLGVRLADVNGDGRVDIISGMLPPKGYQGNSGKIENCKNDQNGKEICELNRNFFKVNAYLNDGKKWEINTSYAPPIPFVYQKDFGKNDNLNVQILDIDGDRLPDLVASFKHPYDETKEIHEIWRNTGSGWSQLKNLQSPILLDEENRDRKLQINWLDINGDGLTDLLTSKRNGNNNESATWLATGNGFVQSSKWQIPIKCIPERLGDSGYRLIDVNGDGYIDIIFSRQVENNKLDQGLFINTGSEWKESDAEVIKELPAFVNEHGVDQGVRLFDVDGNGLLDVIKSFAGGSTDSVYEKHVYLNTGRRSDILEAVDSGYGLKTNIFYQTLQEGNANLLGSGITDMAKWSKVYEAGSSQAYPLISPVPAMYVVRNVRVDEGNGRSVGFSYRYGNYRIHAEAMRPLGFGWRESFNEVTNILSRTELTQDINIGTHVKREATCWIKEELSSDLWNKDNLCPSELSSELKNLVKINESENEWELTEGNVGGSGLPDKKIRQVTLSKSIGTSYELDGKVVAKHADTFDYDKIPSILDRHMNVLKTRSERVDGTAIETFNEYTEDNPQKWYFGRLTKSTVIKCSKTCDQNEENLEKRKVGFSYYRETGLLFSEVVNPDSDYPLRTQYTRDSFGNITKSEVTDDSGNKRSNTTEFDDVGRTKISESNALNHKIRFKPKLTTGVPEETIDPNGVKNTFEYDGFGRLYKLKSPTNIITKIEYLPADRLAIDNAKKDINAAYGILTTVGNQPPTIQIYDNKGRLLRTIKNGYTINDKDNRYIFQDYQYDLIGRLTQSSLPYEYPGKIYWKKLTYDPLNRVIKSLSPDETLASKEVETKFVFSSRKNGGHIETVIDPNGNKSSTEFDTKNLPVAVTDAQNGQVTLKYDKGERPEFITGPMGSITKFQYDDIGRLKQSTDPDRGVWSYEYNGFYELSKKVDANNNIFDYFYDDIGRLKQQSDGQIVDYFYDTAPHGIGKLSKVSSSQGYVKDIKYDKYSRLYSLSEIIGRDTFTTRYDYDQLGRIWKTYYPTDNISPFAIKNNYDEKGYLVKITNLDDSQVFWQAKVRDVYGRLTDQTNGNNTETFSEYYPDTGKIKRILTNEKKAYLILL